MSVSIDLKRTLELPKFARSVQFGTPAVLRAIRDAQFFPGDLRSAIDKPEGDKEKALRDGFLGFLGINAKAVDNKDYVIQVLQNYVDHFGKAAKVWRDYEWQLVAHTEAQELLPELESHLLDRHVWGDVFFSLSAEQRVSYAIQALAIFLLHLFKIALTRTEIRETMRRARKDTDIDPVSDRPSPAPPPAQAEWEDNFRQYLGQLPEQNRAPQYELHYRFFFFKNFILDALQSAPHGTTLEELCIDLQNKTGLPAECVQKVHYLYKKEPEFIKDPNRTLQHILERERQLRVNETVTILDDGKSMIEIQEITQGLTNVQGNHPDMPEVPVRQIVTKEGMPAFIFSTENRVVVRYPTVEYEMHQVFQKVKSRLQGLKTAQKEVLTVTAFEKLRALLFSQVDNVYNNFYASFAYHQAPAVLADLKKTAEERIAIHLPLIEQILPVIEQLQSLIQNGFNPSLFKRAENIFNNQDQESVNVKRWLSSPIAVVMPIDHIVREYIRKLGEGCKQVEDIIAAKAKFEKLDTFVQAYLANITDLDDSCAQFIRGHIDIIRSKWPTFNDCYKVLSIDAKADQAPKAEFMLWLTTLSETLKQYKAVNIPQQIGYLEKVMCQGEVSNSVWKWEQKSFLDQFSLDEDIMQTVWQTWQKGIMDHLLTAQIPDPDQEREKTCAVIMNNLPVFKQVVGRFPALYPEFWYMNPEQYLGKKTTSGVPLTDASHISVSRDDKVEQWEIVYALGMIKLRKIAEESGGRERKKTVFQS